MPLAALARGTSRSTSSLTTSRVVSASLPGDTISVGPRARALPPTEHMHVDRSHGPKHSRRTSGREAARVEQRAPLSFGAALKRHRRGANLTQEQLAEQAGYSVSYISMLERGERVPVHATVELLADALGLTAAEQSAFELAARERDSLNSVPDPPRFSRLVAAPPPLSGRVAELARLDRHRAGDGPPLLLLAGEPGIGKSRLLAEAKRRADASAWTTLAGTAQRGSSRQPYTPLLEAIEQHVTALPSEALRRVLADAPWLTRLLPELADAPPQTSWTLPPEQERRLIFTAVARYLAHMGTHAGTLLILDDLQWAGADALDLLASLVRSPSSARLRVIGAYRESESDPSTPLGDFLADMAAAGLVTHLSLGPLVPDEASALIRDTLPTEHVDGATIERIVARGAGVPFFLVSFAQSLTSGAPNSSATLDDVPWDIAQTIRHRVSALPVESHELLEIAAVCASEASRGVLHSASREIADEDASAVALDAACHARLLTERSDDHYAFSHELARDVVLHEIGPARRALLHLRIAEALETAAGERLAEQLAYHFARGGDAKRANPLPCPGGRSGPCYAGVRRRGLALRRACRVTGQLRTPTRGGGGPRAARRGPHRRRPIPRRG